MKKLLLTAAAASVLATSSAYAAEGMFYVKANAGWFKPQDMKTGYKYDNKDVKFKAKNSMHAGVGVGYNLMDNARVELMFDHYFDPEYKYSLENDNAKIASKLKGNINTLFLNGFFDVFSMDGFSFFLGAGVGMSHNDAKLSMSETNLTVNPNVKTDIEYKAKSNYSFAFAGHAGVGYKIDMATVELSYSYKDLGKTKKFIESSKLPDGVTKRRELDTAQAKGHHVTLGLRFDI